METARGRYASRLRHLQLAEKGVTSVAKAFEADMASVILTFEKRLATERSRLGQGSGMASTHDGVDRELLTLLAKHGGGAAVGFAHGMAEGSNLPPEERLARALMWAGGTGALVPVIVRKLMSELLVSKKPLPKPARRRPEK